MRVKRFQQNPIIVPNMDNRMGDNINGPSLLCVPDWVENPLGRYYLYFAHHRGDYIRMAYADYLEGPWTVFGPGVLELQDSFFDDHIASPDVHVLDKSQEIRMYYHGCDQGEYEQQFTRVAVSKDGLTFTAQPEVLGGAYWRVFHWRDYWYTLEMPGTFRRSMDGLSEWQTGPTLFSKHMRHAAVRCHDDQLLVCYTIAHDCPEHIVWQTMNLADDWMHWTSAEPKSLLKPEKEWEGASRPLVASERGAVYEPVHQLRDPCLFEEAGKTYLLYAVAGEHGIAIAELTG